MLKKPQTIRCRDFLCGNAVYLCFAKLAELFAQVSGVLLEAIQVELHLQAADAVHCIRRWWRHQS